MHDTVTIVDPAAEEEAPDQLAGAPRLATLSGAHLAMIDNSKHMAAELMAEVEGLLRARYGVREFTRYRKANPSIPTPPEVLAGLVSACDGIVHGVAD